MTAIGGFVGPFPHASLESHCSTILDGLKAFRRFQPLIEMTDDAAFGVGLFDLLPEDSETRQPLVGNERFFLVADVRLDNREAVAAGSGVRGRLSRFTDAEIILNAWSRHGIGCLDRLVGDFALAVFDKRDRTLTLARDATGQRPLFYARSNDAVAFASMASGLLNDPEFRRGWDIERTASLINVVGMNEPETYFAGISRVLPGEVITFGRGAQTNCFHWRPLAAEPARMSFEEAVEEYKHVLGSVVECRLRRRQGGAAVHLSSGYDSSAIAAAAALAEPSRGVVAYTAAPTGGSRAHAPPGRLGDESDVASITAARYGLRNKVVHSGDLTLDYLRRQARLYQEPFRNIVNGLWADAIRTEASRDGATVLLNGMAGNMTLNAGGAPYLSDWLTQRGLAQWFRQARAAAQRGDVRWRGILFNTFGPRLPAGLWWRLWRFFRPNAARPLTFLRPEWSLSPDQLQRRSDGQPTPSTAEDRFEFMRALDPGAIHKGGLADSGVWELEPLADRRALEFSISLSPEHLIRDGEYRPVARAALRGLLPPEVVDARRRGIQSVDWQDHFRQREAADILEEIASSDTVRGLLDLEAMRSAIESWPGQGDTGWYGNNIYTSRLPVALTLGVFLKDTEERWNEPGPSRSAGHGKHGVSAVRDLNRGSG